MSLPHISGVFTIGSDPESRTIQSGKTVANFRAVANGYSKDRDNRPSFWVDATWWLPEYDWARELSDSLLKGDRVALEGRLRTDQWEDQHGNRRSKTTLLLDTAPVVIPKRESYGQEQGEPWGSSPRQSQQPQRGGGPQRPDYSEVFGNADDNPPF